MVERGGGDYGIIKKKQVKLLSLEFSQPNHRPKKFMNNAPQPQPND